MGEGITARLLQRRVYVLAVISLIVLTPLSVQRSLAAPVFGRDLPTVSAFHGNSARTPDYAAPYPGPKTQGKRSARGQGIDLASRKRHPHAALESGCPVDWQCQDIGSPPNPGSSSGLDPVW